MYLKKHTKNESFGQSQDMATFCTAARELTLVLQLKCHSMFEFALGNEWFYCVQKKDSQFPLCTLLAQFALDGQAHSWA